MSSSLWTAKTGLDAQQRKMDVITNNLANVGTRGFKRQTVVFQDLMYQTLRQPGAPDANGNVLPTGLQVGTGVRTAATVHVQTEGGLEETGSAYDMAINGAGYFEIELPDGTSAYTRDGSFSLNADGQMVTADGFLLQPGLVVPANALQLTITADGNASVTLPGQVDPVQIGQLQLATFVNPAGLQAIGGNLFIETDASGPPNLLVPGIDGAGYVKQGWIETSNVNVAEELVNMIQTQRAFEMNSKAITTTDQMLQRLTQL